MLHVPVGYTFSHRNFCIRPFLSGCLAGAGFWYGSVGVSDRGGGIGEVAALSFPMAVWGHGLSVSVLPGGHCWYSKNGKE